MLKRIVAIGLCLLLSVSMFTGCEDKKVDTSEQVTLKWSISWGKQKDADEVLAVINEKLAALLPNTKLEFMFGQNPSTWPMLMAAKEPIDIAWTGYTYDMNTEINSESFLDLNDLVKNYGPNIQKEMEEYPVAYKSGSVNGVLYAIPNQQPILHQTSYLGIPEKTVNYFDADAFLAECHSNYKTTEKTYQIVGDYLKKVKDAGLLKTADYNGSIDIQNIFLSMAIRGYDWVDTYRQGAWLCYDAHDENPKIVNFQQTEAYKMFIKYASEWYKLGYIANDVLVTSGAGIGVQYFASGNVTEMWYGLDDEKGVRKVTDGITKEKVCNFLTDTTSNMFQGTDLLGSEKTYEVIPYTSANPERAMMLLDLLRSPEGEDLLNTIVYGIQGDHYELKGDVAYGKGYTAQATSANDYGIPHWEIGNVFLTYRTPNILDGQKEYAGDFLKNVKPTLFKTKLYGFRADSKTLSNKIIQIKEVINEFEDTLVCGVMGDNYKTTYDEFNSKMEAAGLNQLLNDVNQQAQTYIGKNK